ncbi:MAG: hypothetical protein ACRELA_04455 [Candidatus Rokuibacteriota bacterium]
MLGKVVVYSVVGGLVVLLGVRLQAASIPVVVVARQTLGPLMVLAGLGMLGVIRLRGPAGRSWSDRVRRRLPARGGAGAINPSGDRKEPHVSQDGRPVDRSRLTLLAGALALAISLASRRASPAAAPPLPEVTVYKSPT